MFFRESIISLVIQVRLAGIKRDVLLRTVD